jgi:hypothetical protein
MGAMKESPELAEAIKEVDERFNQLGRSFVEYLGKKLGR